MGFSNVLLGDRLQYYLARRDDSVVKDYHDDKEKATGNIVALKKTRLHEDEEGAPSTTLREISILRILARDPHIVRLMDVKQGLSKEGKTVLYLVFEYMDTDVKKYIRSFRHTGGNIPPQIVKRS